MKNIIILIMLLLSSCISPKSVDKESESIFSPTIIFVEYRIYKDKVNIGEINVKQVNQILSEGVLKINSKNFFNPKTGELICFQTDKNNNHIDSTIIPNPFNKVVEFVNGDGEMGKKEIKLDSANFFLRMQLYPKTKYIDIFNNKERLNRHKL